MRGRLREGVTDGLFEPVSERGRRQRREERRWEAYQEPRREPDASRRCDCSKRGVVDGNSERQATGSGRDSRGGCDERTVDLY